MQYTLRNVPPAVDRLLRRRAKELGTSLNEVALDALSRGAGVTDDTLTYRSLRDLSGVWIEDARFDAAIREQNQIDDELWK
jgi:hypothetical protein